MLGSRIAALRNLRGLSQAALATKLSVSPSAIGMYEQGRREPSVDVLVALSREFGVTVDYLLTGQAITKQDYEAISNISKGSRTIYSPESCAAYLQTLTREELVVILAAQLLS